MSRLPDGHQGCGATVQVFSSKLNLYFYVNYFKFLQILSKYTLPLQGKGPLLTPTLGFKLKGQKLLTSIQKFKLSGQLTLQGSKQADLHHAANVMHFCCIFLYIIL